MTFDLFSTVGITAGATVVVATFVALFGSSLTQRISIGAATALWFTGVLWIGAPGTISTPLRAAAVLIPVVVFSVIGFGSLLGRGRLQSAPLPAPEEEPPINRRDRIKLLIAALEILTINI